MQSSQLPTNRFSSTSAHLIQKFHRFPENEKKALLNLIVSDEENFQRFIPDLHELEIILKSFASCPSDYNDKLMQRIFTQQKEFDRLFSSVADIMRAVQFLPAKYAKELILRVRSLTNGETILHMAAKFAPGVIPVILGHGADACAQDAFGNEAIHCLIQREPFASEHINAALALIQRGAKATLKNAADKNILQLIYANYPTVKNYLHTKGIPTDKLDDPEYVFNHINIPSFRMEVLFKSREKYLEKYSGSVFQCYASLYNIRVNETENKRVEEDYKPSMLVTA